MVAIKNNPTHFTLAVKPRNTPERNRETHQLYENETSWYERNWDQAIAVRPVKKRSDESNKISRDWHMKPFSTINKIEVIVAAILDTPKFCNVVYAILKNKIDNLRRDKVVYRDKEYS